MKKLSVFLCAMGFLLVLCGISHAANYHFIGGTEQRFRLKAFIDGEQAIVENGYLYYSGQTVSWMRMDVDTTGYLTTLLELYTEQSIVMTRSGIIREGGFGGLEIPFTVHWTDFIFQSSVSRGPYNISPSSLFFWPEESLTNQNDGLMNIAGFIDMEGQQFTFDVSQPVDSFQANGPDSSGVFDDAGFPSELDVQFYGGPYWEMNSDLLLMQTTIDGKIVEIYADKVWTAGGDNVWHGSLVPIPSAVWLFGPGLIGLIGFRRKFR